MPHVAIIGSAQTAHVARNQRQSTAELIYEVSKEALRAANLCREEIDTVVVASCDILDGISISNAYSVDPSGAFLKDETKVEEDGAFAALYAYLRLRSGTFETALVVAWGKGSEASLPLYTGLIFEPFYQRPLGLEAISAFALQARAYMDRFGVTEEQAAQVAVKNYDNACRNPFAQRKIRIGVHDVLSSTMLASPIKSLDAPPVTDGACAIVMATEKRAQERCERPVWILGVGSATDTYHLGYRDLTELASLHVAAHQAYRIAGIDNPLVHIHVAEVSELFSFQELMIYEALGFCGPGEGASFLQDGHPYLHGSLPVNTSGGCLGANPTPATGLVRLAEAYLQLSGQAGRRQVEGAELALAHGSSGICHQANVVFILGSQLG